MESKIKIFKVRLRNQDRIAILFNDTGCPGIKKINVAAIGVNNEWNDDYLEYDKFGINDFEGIVLKDKLKIIPVIIGLCIEYKFDGYSYKSDKFLARITAENNGKRIIGDDIKNELSIKSIISTRHVTQRSSNNIKVVATISSAIIKKDKHLIVRDENDQIIRIHNTSSMESNRCTFSIESKLCKGAINWKVNMADRHQSFPSLFKLNFEEIDKCKESECIIKLNQSYSYSINKLIRGTSETFRMNKSFSVHSAFTLRSAFVHRSQSARSAFV